MATTYITGFQTTAAALDGLDFVFVQGRINGTSLANAIDATGNENGIFIEGTVSNAPGRGVQISGFGSILNVSPTGQILTGASFGSSAVFLTGTGGSHTVTNYGHIQGNFGITTFENSNNNTIFNHGTVTSTENVFDIAAITLVSTGNMVLNTGSLFGAGNGVLIRASETGNVIVNHGEISGDVGVRTFSGSTIALTNTGTITGLDGVAVLHDGSTGTINNRGVIEGDILATAFGSVVTIRNSGLIEGQVQMGAGDDRYGASGHGQATEQVRGGTGADRLSGGTMTDFLFGDHDNDIVSGQAGDDFLYGGNGADTLRGGSGDDVISGGQGFDTIHGGSGDDTMSGESSPDVFVFDRFSGVDRITDFQNNIDSIDLSIFGLSSFAALRATGAIRKFGAGSAIDLDILGGDGIIIVEDMTVSQWNVTDFDL